MAAGYLSISMIESFVRVIISIYSGSDMILTGVSALPSSFLAVTLTVDGVVFGLIGGFITCSISNSKSHTEILSLIVLVAASGFFFYYFKGSAEPIWYIICDPLLKILGIFAAYKIFLNQNVNKSIEPS